MGGLAVLLHGLDRLTADVDLAIDLSTDATQDTVRALTQGGYRPMAPVDPMSLADPELRRWSFARRTPEQRLAWLVSALQLAYQSGAIKPRRPSSPDATTPSQSDLGQT